MFLLRICGFLSGACLMVGDSFYYFGVVPNKCYMYVLVIMYYYY